MEAQRAYEKLVQQKARHLFQHRTESIESQRRIDDPLVTYNASGVATCRLCHTTIKSATLWPVHQASKKHRQALKQPSHEVRIAPAKKKARVISEPPPAALPTGFFDSAKAEEVEEVEEKPKTIPEGFFDDRKNDIKARGLEKEMKDREDKAFLAFQSVLSTQEVERVRELEESEMAMEAAREKRHEMEAKSNHAALASIAAAAERHKLSLVKKPVDKEDSESGSEDEEDLLDWRRRKV